MCAMQDLNSGLQARGSRLLLVHGDPVHVLPDMITKVLQMWFAAFNNDAVRSWLSVDPNEDIRCG
jgi:deoxyribodipyrimidine photolyase